MKMNERLALSMSGMVLTGAVALIGGPANAATTFNSSDVSNAFKTQKIAADPATRRCRYIRGHYTRRHGRRVWVEGHWSPRGCHRRHR